MSTLHLFSLAAVPSAHLAMSAIATELGHLKRFAEQPENAPIREHVATLTKLCDSVQRVVADSADAISRTSQGLEGLLELLEHAQKQTVTAHRLSSLLAPLQAQLQRTEDHIGQIL